MQQLHFDRASFETELSDMLKYCWVMKAPSGEQQQVPDLLIPDGCPELIFVFEGAYEKVALNTPGHRRIIDQSCVVGIQTATQLVKRLGKVRMMGVKFKPLGFYRYVGDLAAKLIDKNLFFNDLEKKWLEDLQAQLRRCEHAEAAAKVICEAFKREPSHPAEEQLKVTDACIQTIVQTNGVCTVQELAAMHHKSIRQLQRYFKKYIGISPKQFANIIRFKAFYKENVLRQINPVDYFNYGYFDQTHFIKDFRSQLGVTPGKINDHNFQLKNEIARRSHRE